MVDAQVLRHCVRSARRQQALRVQRSRLAEIRTPQDGITYHDQLVSDAKDRLDAAIAAAASRATESPPNPHKSPRLKRKPSQSAELLDPLLKQARNAIGASQRGLAERLYLRAIATDPYDPRPYLLFALRAQKRDDALARELFRAGVEADRMHANILQAWGLFESKAGNLELAQKLIRRSVLLNPGFAPVLKWKNLFPEQPSLPYAGAHCEQPRSNNE